MITCIDLCCFIFIFILHNQILFLIRNLIIDSSIKINAGKLWIFQASLLFDTDTLIILKSVNFSGHHSYSIDTLIRYSRVHPAPRPSLLKAGDLKSMEQVWLFEFLLTQTFCIGPIEFVLSGFHCNLYI